MAGSSGYGVAANITDEVNMVKMIQVETSSGTKQVLEDLSNSLVPQFMEAFSSKINDILEKSIADGHQKLSASMLDNLKQMKTALSKSSEILDKLTAHNQSHFTEIIQHLVIVQAQLTAQEARLTAQSDRLERFSKELQETIWRDSAKLVTSTDQLKNELLKRLDRAWWKKIFGRNY